MSSQTVASQTNNQLFVKTDISKIFLRDNRYQKGLMENGAYEPLVLLAGTVLGRVALTGKIVPCWASATDGSQFPIGILGEDVSVEEADGFATITFVDMGDVADDKVLFYYAGNTLDTVVSTRQFRDYLQAQGIKLIPVIDMTNYDNV